MANNRRLIAVDCETDPAMHGRVPVPFIWGVYDGKQFFYFRSTRDFVEWIQTQNVIAYAHNGGKFDFMFLLQYLTATRAQVINGRIVKMNIGKAQLRDSYSIVPEKLATFGKDEIDYAKMESNVREDHMPEIISYLKTDCVSLYNLVATYREVAGTRTTIASNALAFAKKLGIQPGKSSWRYDNDMRRFFHGGRCQVFQPGIHKQLRVIDIHSAYPFAMMQDHPSGTDHKHITPREFLRLPRSEKQICLLRLSCFSNGAFPLRTKTGLDFPVDKGEYCVTGWEYVAAMELDLLRDVEFHEIIWHEGRVNFAPYVNHWYEKKRSTNKKTDPINYTIAKILMNSLFGKMAQDISRYYDYKIVPAGTFICDDYQKQPYSDDCANCGDRHDNHGWLVDVEYENVEVFSRSALWKYEQKYGEDWKGRLLYNNVSTGASITGFTRAHLLRAMHGVGFQNVMYCDTDSIICKSSADLRRIKFSDALGDWADEGTAEYGGFGGKKLYALKMTDGSEKIASKGAKLTFAEIMSIVNGETVQNRASFPSFSIAGAPSFVVRNIRRTAIEPLIFETQQKETRI